MNDVGKWYNNIIGLTLMSYVNFQTSHSKKKILERN